MKTIYFFSIKDLNNNDLDLSDLFVMVTVGSSNDQSFVVDIIPLQVTTVILVKHV